MDVSVERLHSLTVAQQLLHSGEMSHKCFQSDLEAMASADPPSSPAPLPRGGPPFSWHHTQIFLAVLLWVIKPNSEKNQTEDSTTENGAAWWLLFLTFDDRKLQRFFVFVWMRWGWRWRWRGRFVWSVTWLIVRTHKQINAPCLAFKQSATAPRQSSAQELT